jgi:hypothetical protein
VKSKGVTYDVGRVLGGNWCPAFEPEVFDAINQDLHCNTIWICGLDISGLEQAVSTALSFLRESSGERAAVDI